MAVIIDMDFKIPSCCNECQMCSCQRIGMFYCDLTTEYIDIDSDLRDADCPLKEVPSGKWISVSEGLPKEGEKLIDDDVLVFCEDSQIRIGFCMGADLNGNREWCVNGEYSKVIAWMPLPEPYEPVSNTDNLEEQEKR